MNKIKGQKTLREKENYTTNRDTSDTRQRNTDEKQKKNGKESNVR